MADFRKTHPLEQFFEKQKPGASDGGVTVQIIEDCGIIQVFAASDKTSAVERALKIKETPGNASATDEYTAIPMAPGQWLLVTDKPENATGFADRVQAKLKKNGYVSQQSDSRVIFRLSGNRVRELMQKGCRLDLHPSVTGAGWCAQTQMAQIGTLIHQRDEKPTFDIMVYSGYAREFAEWLHHSGASLGLSFNR